MLHISSAPFSASKLKIKRAARHLGELNEAVRRFAATKPFRLIVEAEGSDRQILRIQGWPVVPESFAPIIGDVLHNLRAPLDLLACDLVRINNGNDNNVCFPFSESGDGLEAAIKRCNFNRASPDSVDLVRSLRPFKGGNDALRAIHDLDITDKHKALIPIASRAGLPPFSIGGSVFHIASMDPMTVDVVASCPAAQNLSVGQEFPVDFRLAFPRDTPLSNKEVVTSLHGLMQLVTSVVEAFETLCSGKPNAS
jgi:hypothetical protein